MNSKELERLILLFAFAIVPFAHSADQPGQDARQAPLTRLHRYDPQDRPESSSAEINPALLYWQAFAVMPDLSPSDQKHLFENDWGYHTMDARAGELVARFDQSFRILRRASESRLPCDWGVDMAAGPYAVLPHLGKAKRLAQVATFRAQWFVQNEHPEAARADLEAAFVLGRNLSRDQVIISGLVQIAIENVLSEFVIQHWRELTAQTIGEILAGFDNAPARGTMADCIRTEKITFHDWLVRKIEELQLKYPGDDAQALRAASEVLAGMVGPSEGSEPSRNPTAFASQVIRAAGNSTAGLIQYLRDMEGFYMEVEQAMKLPYAEYQPAIDEIQKRIAAHPNLLLREFFPAVLKVRVKEFSATARLAMLHAAYQSRIDQTNGLRQVQDPFGTGPFEYSRFVFEGVDRGFKLKSQLKLPASEEVQIYVEKPGPAFYVDGAKAGQKVP